MASLYKEISYPSAAKFKAALTKRGIDVPDAFVKQIVSEQGSRQLYAPPPKFTGKVSATNVDDRWAADVLDFQSKTRSRARQSMCCWCKTSSAAFSSPLLSAARQK